LFQITDKDFNKVLIIAGSYNQIRNYYDFLLYKDTKNVLIYESYADVFHITKISLYRDIINLETEKSHDSKNFLWEISHDL